METTSVTSKQSATATNSSATGTSSLSGEDFFKLLIAELTNQDPLEPTSNQDLLNQISSIRDIELSTSLSESLGALTEQQRFSSVSSLIGQFVMADDVGDGTGPVAGVVSAVRFDAAGKATLELSDGTSLSVDQVDSVMTPQGAAENLIGSYVTALDRSDPASPSLVEGYVTSIAQDSAGRMTLGLDSGETVQLSDVNFSYSGASSDDAE